MLTSLLCYPGPQPCRLMFREIFTATSKDEEMYEALISSVVNEFIRPVDQSLIKLIRHLAPTQSQRSHERAAQSIAAECFYYVTHRPFIERLRGVDLSESNEFDETVEHISRFVLAGLGSPQSLIDATLKIARQTPVKLTEQVVSAGTLDPENIKKSAA
jgi:hypothetical protein